MASGGINFGDQANVKSHVMVGGDFKGNVTVGTSASKERIEQLKETEEKTAEQVKEVFGTGSTMALVLSGVGDSEQQKKDFKQNLENAKEMLTDHFNIKSDNIYTVGYIPGDTRRELLKKFKDIRERKEKNGNFLFYFLGHNNKSRMTLHIDDQGIDDTISYEDLKERLTGVQAPNKLFIIDTCYSGAVDLKDEEAEEEELFPLLWDVTLDGEEDVSILQWRSSQKDETSFFQPTKKIGFTSAIQEVLSHSTCKESSCKKLRSDFADSFIPAGILHNCVCDHFKTKTIKQKPRLDFNQGNENMHLFPLIAKQT